MSSTRKRVNTRSNSSHSNSNSSTTSDAVAQLPKVDAKAVSRTRVPSPLVEDPSKPSTSGVVSTSGKKTASKSSKKNNKRKLTTSMENLGEPASNELKTDAVNGGDQPNKRRAVERLIAVSKVYLSCEVEVYDEKLHNSIDKMIDSLDSAEADLESTPDDLLPAVTERHLELLNVRMKLLKLNSKQSSATSKAASKTASTPVVDIDLSKDDACFYCRGDHAPERCTIFPLARRSNIIKKRKRCFRCLLKFNEGHQCEGVCTICERHHHVSLCKQDAATFVKKVSSKSAKKAAACSSSEEAARTGAIPKKASTTTANRRTPITEPPIPENLFSLMDINIRHPRELRMNLLTGSSESSSSTHSVLNVVYMPSITVKVVSPSGSALGRCMVNNTSGVGCFVSPRFLARINVRPTRLTSPRDGLTVNHFFGTFKVKEFVVLELESPYREGYRFKAIFYVHDVSIHALSLPTPEVIALAEAANVQLSHQFEPDRTLDHFDLVIGLSHSHLTGFEMTSERSVALTDQAKGINVNAYYTHFGYLLCGSEKPAVDRLSVALAPTGGSSSSGAGARRGGGGSGGSSAGGRPTPDLVALNGPPTSSSSSSRTRRTNRRSGWRLYNATGDRRPATSGEGAGGSGSGRMFLRFSTGGRDARNNGIIEF